MIDVVRVVIVVVELIMKEGEVPYKQLLQTQLEIRTTSSGLSGGRGGGGEGGALYKRRSAKCRVGKVGGEGGTDLAGD